MRIGCVILVDLCGPLDRIVMPFSLNTSALHADVRFFTANWRIEHFLTGLAG